MSEPTDLVRKNLALMLAADGRTLLEIAEQAFPDRSPNAGRKLIDRAIDSGWLLPHTAKGLMVALGVEHLAEFYLPAEPELTELRVRRARLRAAGNAVKAARESLKAERKAVRSALAEFLNDVRCLAE